MSCGMEKQAETGNLHGTKQNIHKQRQKLTIFQKLFVVGHGKYYKLDMHQYVVEIYMGHFVNVNNTQTMLLYW